MDRRRIIIIGGVVLLVVVVWIIFPKGKKAAKSDAQLAPSSAKAIYARATQYHQQNNLLEARTAYEEILVNYPDFNEIEKVQKQLEEVNLNIILSNMEAPKTVTHQVVRGDTLNKLAKKYGTTVELIKLKNNLKNDIIRIGQNLRIWTGTFNLLIDKSQNILILKDDDEVVKVYNVATGENNTTPTGTFKITTKLVDPVWFKAGAIIPPESPQNVLGSRWLGFDMPGYGIHGTIEPETMGQQITAGCVRMRNEDVEELYSLIPTRTQVVIIN